MKLGELLQLSHQLLTQARAPHALIGAFGMAAHGYQRATNDIDFLVDGDFRAAVEAEFMKSGFSVFNSNEELVQLQGPGVVDIIFARRPLSKKMLSRKNLRNVAHVPALDAEDIIGLKIQALASNPARKLRDLADIESLNNANKSLDWKRIKEYADLFGVWDLLKEIQKGHTK